MLTNSFTAFSCSCHRLREQYYTHTGWDVLVASSSLSSLPSLPTDYWVLQRTHSRLIILSSSSNHRRLFFVSSLFFSLFLTCVSRPEATPVEASLHQLYPWRPRDGMGAPPVSRLGIFSARDMRETASATRSSMGSEALQKAMEACGAARHGLTISAGRGFGAGAGSGAPEHETGKMPMLNEDERRRTKARAKANEGERRRERRWAKRVQAEKRSEHRKGGPSGKGKK